MQHAEVTALAPTGSLVVVCRISKRKLIRVMYDAASEAWNNPRARYDIG